MNISDLKKELKAKGSKKRAIIAQGFFKTAKGEYGEGDIFLGITVPDVRLISKKYIGLPLHAVKKLLMSPVHEERQAALIILIDQYQRGDDDLKKKIFEIYLNSTKYINNWDLIDFSAEKIIGHYLWHYCKKDKRSVLYEFARSKDLWKKRIAVMSTYFFIKNSSFLDVLKISKILLLDKHDLIHKAVGWMLREVGKRSMAAEKTFLDKHSRTMPRTMLRYAIEKFDENMRQIYLTNGNQ